MFYYSIFDSKIYNISTIKIFYFVFYFNFQCYSKQTFKKHNKISFFEATYQNVERGFRYCFRNLNLKVIVYYTLCNILNFLCIDTFVEPFVDVVIENLKSDKEHYEKNYRKPFFVKGNKTIAKNSCFSFLYFISRTKLENDTKTF